MNAASDPLKNQASGTGGPPPPRRAAQWRRLLVPFLLGLGLGPLFIVLHEGGHFIVGAAAGLHPRLHYRETTLHPTSPVSRRMDFGCTAGGPVVQAMLGIGGLLWLYRRRRSRRQAPATELDWVATWLALNGGRWLAAGLGGIAVGTRLKDEAWLTAVCGLPIWIGLLGFGLTGLFLVVMAIRLHPPKARLFPFLAAIVGGVLGVQVWFRWLGPHLLP